MDDKYWDQQRERWNGHDAFQTVNHHHVSCYSPAEGCDSCDLMIVECADGRWYVEDNWGNDSCGAERVWRPFDRNAGEPYFFGSQEEALAHATAVVARVCGVPEAKVGWI